MADWARLAREIEGEVHVDLASRGRHATDASFCQIVPEAVVVPARFADVEATLAREAGVPSTARGGGASRAGQTLNSGVVADFSKRPNGVRAPRRLVRLRGRGVAADRSAQPRAADRPPDARPPRRPGPVRPPPAELVPSSADERARPAR